MSKLSRHIEAIRENTVDLISEEELALKLKESFRKNRPLKLKIGFDPTARDIHLGHTVLLRKLRRLQDLGHRVYFIIGDFTARIGDPSGRTTARPVLSASDIKTNALTYTRQAFKILDRKKTRIIYNSIWYKKMRLEKFLSLISSYTVARILERDDFSQRIKENRPLTLLEIIYPLIQGYDSCKIEADIEFGGTDQKFNLIVGRHLQQVFGQKPQVVATLPILAGLDGKHKMSKSLDNYIGVTESLNSMFGKLMSIPDEIMGEYFRLLTDFDTQRFSKLHPKEAKLALAESITSVYYSPRLAKREREEFERVFSDGELPAEMPVYKAAGSEIDLIEVLHKTKLTTSRNEARRLLSQGGISAAGGGKPAALQVVKQSTISIPVEGVVLKIGKRRFLKVIR